MKVQYYLFLLLATLVIGCNKSASDDGFCAKTLSCDDCVSMVQNVNGTTTFLSCFGRYGVYYVNGEGNKVWAIPYEWDKKYEKDSLNVMFCGYLFTNDVPLTFPDPSIGPVYRIRFEDLSLK